jgi:hypothetical protein
MLARKPRVSTTDITNREQLELLYARRTIIDALIASLQVYDRFHSQRVLDQKRQPA